MSQKELVPKRRFEGFTDEWKERSFDEEIEIYNGLTYSPDDIKQSGTFVLRSSNVQNGEIVNADNVYVNSEVVNARNVKTGDIIVVVRNGSRSLIGKHAKIKTRMDKTVIGAFMTGIRSNQPDFINALLDTQNFRNEIDKNLGATINQITNGMFGYMSFFFPSIKEQQQIGQFFKHLDDMIALQQKKIDKTRALKSAYLAEMFPAEGERVPKRRFAGFKDSWEFFKLKDLIVSEEKGRARADMIGNESIYLDTTYLNGGETLFVNSPTNVEKDDVLILWDGSHAGKVYHGFNGALGSTLKALKPIESGSFIYYYLYFNQKKIFEQYRTPNIPHVINTFTDEFTICKPSLEEQLKIGAFFKKIDDIITTHEQKLEKLKAIKQAYLHEMFV